MKGTTKPANSLASCSEFVSTFVSHFNEKWHETNATPSCQTSVTPWRLEVRMKTLHISLVMALNIGTDPPDTMRSSPTSRIECWVDPYDLPSDKEKASDIISRALQEQYARWQPRARYKRCTDPTVDFIQKLSKSMRRAAKETRVLFHYNGRGVPKPTPNGEIWFFNSNFTQYVPLSIFDLDIWNGYPAIYVFDCNAAGTLVRWFNETITQQQIQSTKSRVPEPDCIVLAGCGENETLPLTLDLPADIFTACLTTPIKMSLHWTCVRSVLFTLDPAYIDDIPGHFNDRRSPMGELNWIFTAITDTIAWITLPGPLFRRLYRQDALLASMMRNYLLAERILKACGCTPTTIPNLPPMNQHPLWNAWDVTVDFYLAQLPNFIRTGEPFQSNPFFPDQLTAFEIWLEFAHQGKLPEQLPIVLQVLLSKQHRERALKLLARFLDLGEWAVSLALSVGTFPYVLKLLQSPAPELRGYLVFIWAKILVVDHTCQMDLYKEHAELYFLPFLTLPNIPIEQCIQSVFILSEMMNNCPPGQYNCIQGHLMKICQKSLNHPNSTYRQWILLCLAKLWEDFPEAKALAFTQHLDVTIQAFLTDVAPLVRTAAVYAISMLISGPGDDVQQQEKDLALALSLAVVTADMTSVARKELLFALIRVVILFEDQFNEIVIELTHENMKLVAELEGNRQNSPIKKRSPNYSRHEFPPRIAKEKHIFVRIWRLFLSLRMDPHPDCSCIARSFFSAYMSKISLLPEVRQQPRLQNFLYRVRNDVGSMKRSRKNIKSPTRSTSGRLRREGSSGSFQGSAPSSPIRMTSHNPVTPLNPSPESIANMLSLEKFPSQFYQWSRQYFGQKFSELSPENDESSPISLERTWRRKRQQSYFEQTLSLKEASVRNKFETQIALINDSSIDVPSVLRLHPSEPICVFSDNHSNISVWNWRDSVRLSLFNNLSPNVITAMSLINTQERFRAVVGSADGIIRVWGNVDHSPKLLTSWRAFSDDPSRSFSNRTLVFDWNNTEECLLTSGITPVIRMWDIEKGLSVQDISSPIDNSPVTSLTHHQEQPLFVAGYGGGSIQIFDMRNAPEYSPSISLCEHKMRIIDAKIPRSSTGSLVISGAASGIVKLWDIRKYGSSLRSIRMHSHGMTAFDVHNHAPIFSTGGPSQVVKIMSYINGTELSAIRYHTSLILGQRIGPLSCLAFHPHRLILAAGATDSIISMYQSDAV